MAEAVVAVTPLTVGGAVAAHLLTLSLWTEALRTALRAGKSWSCGRCPWAMLAAGLGVTAMSAAGLLPLGIGTGPATMVAALGTTNFATATAAGMVVSAVTIVSVLI